MILIKLQGGLGNQMFQYATARSLAHENEIVYLNHDFFKHTETTEDFIARKYELGIFSQLKAVKAGSSQDNLFNHNSLFYKMKRLSVKLVYIKQNANEFISFERFRNCKHIYLDGFFQSEKYFINTRQQLLDEFRFPEFDLSNISVRNKIDQSLNSVSIHIRRTDFLIPRVEKVHGVLPLEYYHKALATLKNKYNNLDLFFFSDDIEWVKDNFSDNEWNCHFITGNTGDDSWKDMALMACCKHHIVANSSFSWWGAWLSTKTGCTYAPFKWVNPESMEFNIHDFVPASWNIVYYD